MTQITYTDNLTSSLAGLLSGTVQADEAYIGGEPKDRNRKDAREKERRHGTTDKTPVFSVVDYETREVRSRVLPTVNAATLLPAMRDQLDLPNTYLHTDSARVYWGIAPHVRAHEAVSHEAGQYVRKGGISTNLNAGYFSQLKRSLDGTHHAVSGEHLDRYLAQFDFMYFDCRQTDSQRLRRLTGQADGRRLTYKRLIGKA